MLKSKSFPTPAAAVRWVNKQEEVRVVGVVPEARAYTLIYKDPANLAETRLQAVKDRVTAHLGFSREVKESMNISPKISGLDLIPLARITSALRNLKAFNGLSTREVGNYIRSVCPELGFAVLPAGEARLAYGVTSELIQPV